MIRFSSRNLLASSSRVPTRKLNFWGGFYAQSREGSGVSFAADERVLLRFNSSLPEPSFRYAQLHDTQSGSKDAFRILELLSGRKDEPLRCHLRYATLSSAPDYETMSYRWGDRTDEETIECNGASLTVPAALSLALRNLRYLDRPRMLWADAACINQKNLREKEQQVQLMRDIYSRSRRTLIWLGDQPNLKMSWTASIPIFFSLSFFKRRVKNTDIPKMRFYNYHTGSTSLVSPLSAEGYIAYVNMLRNQWFQRAWVVQEVAVSNDPTAIWNGHEIPWSDIVHGLEFLSRMDFGLAFIPTLQHIASIESERRRYQGEKADLLGILQRHQRCEAADDRDKIFAFAGLTSSLPCNFTIDYKKPAEEIYKDVARGILMGDKSLSLLSQPAALAHHVSTLPSWVPDWSCVRAVKMSHSWGLEARALSRKTSLPNHGLSATFAAAPTLNTSPSFSSNGLDLQVSGHIIDTIAETGDIFEGVELPPPVTGIRGIVKGWIFTSQSYVKAQRVLMGWESIAGAREPNRIYEPTKEPILDAYWKTVSAGEYPHIEGVRIEVKIWNRVNRLAWRLRKYKAEGLVLLPYSILLSIWQAVSKGPAFKFHIQGHYTLYRRMAWTKKGYLALVSPAVQSGDAVFLLKGSNVPLVLGQTDSKSRYMLKGDAYTHGVMFGEAWKEAAAHLVTIC